MMTSASERGELLFLSPLFIATLLDNLAFVKQLIEQGANPLDRDENNYTMLHFAAANGRLKILKYLEDRGCNLATGGGDVCNVLHVAVEWKQTEVVKYLIEQCQVDPSEFDSFKLSPLSYACKNGDTETATFLIEHMKDMKMEYIFYRDDALLGKGSIGSPLCCACLTGELSVVKYLVEECGCDPARPENGDEYKTPLMVAVVANHLHIVKYLAQVKVPGPTAKHLHPLHTAVKKQNLEMVKCLIESFHCDPNHKHSTRSLAPLHLAAMVGSLSIVKYLLSLKCDPNVKESDGYQPIHFAAAHGHLAVLKYLIEVHACSPSSSNNDGKTPLFLAADDGHLSVFRYLSLEHGCDPLQVAKHDSTSIFHDAALKGYLDIVKFIILELKCDPYCNGQYDVPPLHYAAAGGNLEIVRFLIDQVGCDPLIRDNMQRTALHVAARDGQLSVLKYLIEDKKCDPYDADLDQNDAVVNSAISGNLHILQYLINEIKVDKNYQHTALELPLLSLSACNGHLSSVEYLLEIGSKSRDGLGLSPLDHAARCGHLEIVKYLMTHHPDMFSEVSHTAGDVQLYKLLNHSILHDIIILIDDLEASPVHCAAFNGHLHVVQYLVGEMNCNVNSKNKMKRTPLHLAAACGHLNVVQYLIGNKADPLCCDLFGDTPVHYAAVDNRLEVVKILTTSINPSLIHNKDVYTPLHLALLHYSWITALYLIVKIFNYHS